jgi:hypothetical protein
MIGASMFFFSAAQRRISYVAAIPLSCPDDVVLRNVAAITISVTGRFVKKRRQILAKMSPKMEL